MEFELRGAAVPFRTENELMVEAKKYFCSSVLTTSDNCEFETDSNLIFS